MMRSRFLTRAAVGAILCGWLCFTLPTLAAAQDSSTAKPATAHKAKKQSKHSAATGKTASTGKHSRKSKSRRKRGQQAIDSPRAREIQEALIREHYLDGEPSGKWDAATQAALQRYQADQGWQTKTVPDSRALIKLGLGPSKDGLLNPESAMTTAPTTAAAKVVAKPNSADPPAPSKPPSDETPQP